jgi:hypothetical protein
LPKTDMGHIVAERGYRSISLKADLVNRAEKYAKNNDEGFSSAADVVAAALRRFLDGRSNPIPDWEAMLRAEVRTEVERQLNDRRKR